MTKSRFLEYGTPYPIENFGDFDKNYQKLSKMSKNTKKSKKSLKNHEKFTKMKKRGCDT